MAKYRPTSPDRIASITSFIIRHYTDNDQWLAHCEWVNFKGDAGKTSGAPRGEHMTALRERARRENIPVRFERW